MKKYTWPSRGHIKYGQNCTLRFVGTFLIKYIVISLLDIEEISLTLVGLWTLNDRGMVYILSRGTGRQAISLPVKWILPKGS